MELGIVVVGAAAHEESFSRVHRCTLQDCIRSGLLPRGVRIRGIIPLGASAVVSHVSGVDVSEPIAVLVELGDSDRLSGREPVVVMAVH